MLTSSLEAVSIVGTDGTIRYASPSWATVLGIDPGAALRRSPLEFVVEPDRAAVLAEVAAHRAEGSMFELECRVVGTDDGVAVRRWVHRCEVRYDDPLVRGLLILTRDVTAERAAAQELAQRRSAEATALEILRRRAVLDRRVVADWGLDALGLLASYAGADRVAVLLVDPEREMILGEWEWAAPGVPAATGATPRHVPVVRPDRLEAWLRDGAPFEFHRRDLPSAPPVLAQIHATRPAASTLLYPTATALGPVIVAVQSVALECAWPSGLVPALRLVAEPLGAALAEVVAHAGNEIDRRADTLLAELMHRLVHVVSDELEVVLAWFAEAVGRFLDADRVSVSAIRSDGRLLHRPVWRSDGAPTGVLPLESAGRFDLSAIEALAADGVAVLSVDELERPPLSAMLVRMQPRAAQLLLAPLKARGRALGTIGVARVTPKVWSGRELEFLRVAADAMASAFLRREAEQRLLDQVTTDPLTGLGNRRALVEHLGALVSRPSARAAVAFLDLDGFKAVNDRFGHGAGDDVLRTVAERLAAVARRDELVARLGGDEFVVVADHVADLDAARALGERFRSCTAGMAGPGGTVLELGMSIGVVVSDTVPAPADVWLQRADEAMYEAKRRRDQTVVVRRATPAT